MKLKYGDISTYNYSLNKEKLKWVSNKFNRSENQSLFLYQLVDGDFEKLVELELKIKNCFIWYCPADSSQIQLIMNLTQKTTWFHL